MRASHAASRLRIERLNMTIFKGDGFVPDDWRHLAQGEDVVPSGRVILTLTQWQAMSAPARSSGIPLGLLVEPGDDLRAIAPDLARFALIAISFPKFTDGRGYSLARRLRSHYGFAGELRATGDILFDQLQLLARCGFDSFEIKDAITRKLLEAGRRAGFENFYQPGLGPEIPERTRPWARRAAT
jgi:uncharacterized protein (DUF934 family)